MGDDTEAVDAHKAAWNRGWSLFQSGDFEQSISQLRLAVELRPASPASCWALGHALFSSGRIDEAELMFLRALAFKDAYLRRNSLAFLYLSRGRVVEAERVHLEGLRLAPQDQERRGAYADFVSDVSGWPAHDGE